jgi:microcystin-dependent protein
MSDQFLGEIRMFAGPKIPPGWALCDGQLLSIFDYPELYSLIGTRYGGDGMSTFAVPDLRGRVAIHMGTNPDTGTEYRLGEKGGKEMVTLVLDQLPNHTHLVNAQVSAGTSTNPENKVWAAGTMVRYSGSGADGLMSAAAIGIAGGNQPHNNLMPFVALNFIIALNGVYPNRP